MRYSLVLFLGFWGFLGLGPANGAESVASEAASAKKVFILPIREDIMPPLVYLVRRGVKEAMEARADLLILDMDTNGGQVDVTEEIIEILNRFPGQKVTYVNRKAFSAGVFIAVATQKIFMTDQSVIGAAAPIMMLPGVGVEKMPDTVEAKMTSGISALVRANAEKNGYNVAVIEAMIDKTKELKMDDEVLNEKGHILTLTNVQAEHEYGHPKKPLLSSGTFPTLDALIEHLGYAGATQKTIQPLGAERLASWINAISPILLIIGIIGLYIEFKTPGFGLPGIVGIVAFGVYFLGGYVAGLAGWEWAALFVLGLALVILELFVFPGTTLLGLAGTVLMLSALLMGMVDFYPGTPWIPTLPQLQVPVRDLSLALFGALLIGWILSRWLPQTPLYGAFISQSASGTVSVQAQAQQQASRIGLVGVAFSVLRPGGKAQFGEDLLDVITQGEMIAKGQPVRIIGCSGTEVIVEPVESANGSTPPPNRIAS